MNSLSFTSSLILPRTSEHPPYHNQLQLRSNHHRICSKQARHQLHPMRIHQLSVCAAFPPKEGAVPVIDFEDFIEKDWSFLEPDSVNSKEENERKINRVISAGNVVETSRVLVCIGSDDFVDRLVESSSTQFMLIVHDSLLMLAGIKERYDKVKCWQGELIYVPEKWAPFDVVFLYFLPALPFKLDEIFKTLANRCSPGAKVVISHLWGRQVLDQQKQRHPDVIVSELPDGITLENVAAHHSFSINEFEDQPGFYFAVLEFKS